MYQYGVAANHCVLESGQAFALGRAGTPLNGGAPSQSARIRWREPAKPSRFIAALDPAFPSQQPDFSDFQWPSTPRVGRQGEAEREVKVGAKEKWSKHNESALSGDTPLPLPMAYPGTEPASQREIDAMMNCDPEVEVRFLFVSLNLFFSILFTPPATAIVQTLPARIKVFSRCKNLGLELAKLIAFLSVAIAEL